MMIEGIGTEIEIEIEIEIATVETMAETQGVVVVPEVLLM
jgi:hypothetical protein